MIPPPRSWVRYAQAAVGLVFLLSALAKALDFGPFTLQIGIFGLLRNPQAIPAAASVLILVEAAIGLALLSRLWLGGVPFVLAALALGAFSGLLAYGWLFRGLEDCGCFGRFLRMSPPISLLKNLALFAALVAAWRGWRAGPRSSVGTDLRFLISQPPRLGPLLLGFMLVVAALVVGRSAGSKSSASPDAAGAIPPGRPFASLRFDVEGETWDLGEGDWFVALLDVNCAACIGSVAVMNQFKKDPDMPRIVALCPNEPNEIEDFRYRIPELPEFPIQTIPMEAFKDMIGEHKPRLALIRDGAFVRVWDAQIPPEKELREALAKIRRAEEDSSASSPAA